MHHWGRTCAPGTKHEMHHWGRTCEVSLGPGSELGDYSIKCSLSFTGRSLWSKQKRMWRRSLVRPSVCLSVCDAVQETKRFAGCRQIRHGMILRNWCSFECCANGLNNSSTLPIWVHFSAGDHMQWRLWATVTSSKWGAMATKEIFVRIFLYFQFISQEEGRGHVHGTYKVTVSLVTVRCTENWAARKSRKWTSFRTSHKYCSILGRILRTAFVFESLICCLRFVPAKLPHYLFTFSVSVLSYK